MAYLAELRASWRPILAATVGMASGMSVVGVITSTIAPSLVADVGWSRADFAMVGSLALLMSAVFPFVGRLADVAGVRRTALIGQIMLPLVYLAYSLTGKALWVYVAIFAIQSLTCVTTTSTVYTRLAVQAALHVRGLALGIVAAGPAVSGMVIAPVLNAYVESHGWRAAYQMVALFSAVGGTATFLLTPASSDRPPRDGTIRVETTTRRRARDDYPAIVRRRAFWILAAAMLLCNLPQTILLAQLKFLLVGKGVGSGGVAAMLGTSSAGMLAGRFLTGVALDRLRTAFVSFVGLGIPSIGLFLFASGLEAPAVLAAAVFLLGFAFGAEGDILAFLVARHFRLDIYSSAFGLLSAINALSIALGALLLGYTLARTGSYDLYLTIVGTAVLIGAALTLFLGSTHPPRPAG